MDLRETLGASLGGSYTIERELGGGGMARVFLAEERRLGRKVVIKTIASELLGELSTGRFEREMTLAASLQHPHIVPVLSAGVAGDVPYYTMPFVEGDTLRARLDREGRFPIDDVVRILAHLATAMSYAHNHDVIHRDIKPDNILLSDGIAVVTDFGVAKALSVAQPHGATLTFAGTAIGTPAYMAPEQAAGDTCDARADIYSFGVVGYEMLAGSRPFEHTSVQRLIAAQLTEKPKQIGSLREDVPPDLAHLIMRCLAKEPAERPTTSAELLTILRRPGSSPTRSFASGRRRRPVIAMATILLAVVVVFGSRIARKGSGGPAGSAPAVTTPAVAVLPFENLARDSASEYISDGLTDEVLATLDRVPTLRVASRATSFAYKGKHEDPRSLAKALGVDALLTGSVRRDGDVIMLQTQLVSASTGLPLWSQTYERPLQDLFQIQGDIARSIASALRVTLAPGVVPSTRATKDAVAYDLYLKGRQFMRDAALGDSGKLELAADHFSRAIIRDPDFALAHAYLARTYVRLADHIAPRLLIPKAKAAASRAIQLDPTLIDASLALASIRLSFEWDWEGAENEYRRALAQDSTSTAARGAYVQYLSAARRFDEALLEMEILNRHEREQAVDSSALTANHARRIALGMFQLGRYAESDSLHRIALALDTGHIVRWQYGNALVQMGRAAEGVRQLESVRQKRGEQLPYLTHLGIAYARAGLADSARRILASLESRARREYVPKDQLSALYLALGDTTNSLRWLALAVKERHFWMPYLNGSPLFDELRGHPEFRRLMREVGAPER